MNESIISLAATFPGVTDSTTKETPRPRIGIIVHSARARDEMQKTTDPEARRFHFISNNQNTRGFRYEAVLVTDMAVRHAFNMGRTARDRFDVWLADVKEWNLRDGGPLIRLP